MKSKILFTWLLLLAVFSGLAQEKTYVVENVVSRPGVSMRGLSVVSDKVIWLSGSHGTVGRSIDGGKNWKWFTVAGFEKTEFRDIEGFDAQTAVIMGIGEPAVILKTYNGGESWKKVYENPTKGMFLDAMEFWNSESGIVVGDPIEGRFFISRTFDGGTTWKDIPYKIRPVADSGEALFAASGTNIRRLDRDEAVFVTGGLKSRMFVREKSVPLPLAQGNESTGANSIAVRDIKKRKKSNVMIVVGGNYSKDTVSAGNCVYTHDGGKTWISPLTPPSGYRSCVEYVSKEIILACGTSGVDLSTDGGKNFRLITKEGYHVCRKAKEGKIVFLAGNGKVAQLILR